MIRIIASVGSLPADRAEFSVDDDIKFTDFADYLGQWKKYGFGKNTLLCVNMPHNGVDWSSTRISSWLKDSAQYGHIQTFSVNGITFSCEKII